MGRASTTRRLALLALSLSAAARAQQSNLSSLRPASGSDGLVSVEGARPLDDELAPVELHLLLDGAFLPVRDSAAGMGRAARIDRRLGGFIGLQARLDERLALFAQLPLTLSQAGDVSALGGALAKGAGDLRVGLRTPLLHETPARLSAVAAQLSVDVPTAQAASFTGDGRIVVEGLVSGARRFPRGDGSIELLANALVRLRPPRDLGRARTGNELGLRGGASWLPPLRPSALWPRRVFAELVLDLSLRDLSLRGLPIEWRAGATLCATDAISVEASLGTRLDDGLGAPSARAVLGLRYAPGYCKGPLPLDDTDAKATRVLQELAAERAARDALEERRGAQLDEAETAAAGAASLLEQGERLARAEAEAARRAGAVANQDRDSDGDGVPDRVDNCPAEPGPASNHGCPLAKKQLVVLREGRIEILDKVYFRSGRATLDPRSYKLLDQVAAVLLAHPELLLVRVDGHTDDVGNARANLALSQARAESVAAYLRKKHVAAARLQAKGFGSSLPIAPHTKAGREQNRRVELNVLKRGAARPDPLGP